VVPQTEVKLVKLDDSSGTPLGPNENGEILVRVSVTSIYIEYLG